MLKTGISKRQAKGDHVRQMGQLRIEHLQTTERLHRIERRVHRHLKGQHHRVHQIGQPGLDR